MANMVVTITKQEVEEAVKRYLADRVRGAYSYNLSEPKLAFMNRDGDVGNFTVSAEMDIERDTGDTDPKARKS